MIVVPSNPGNKLPPEYMPNLLGSTKPRRPDADPRHAADLDEAKDAGGPERPARRPGHEGQAQAGSLGGVTGPTVQESDQRKALTAAKFGLGR